MVTDAQGNVLKRLDFLPFGEDLYAGIGQRSTALGYETLPDPAGVPNRFTGQYRDSETGLDFFGARYFAGALGRFTSVDPESAGVEPVDPQTWNAYAYVTNNPLKYVDPDGRQRAETLMNQDIEDYARGRISRQELVNRWKARAAGAVAGLAAAGGGYGTANWVRSLSTAFLGWVLRNPEQAQEVGVAAIETALGYEGPTVTGNVARLSEAEFETGVRLAKRLGQNVSVSTHVGAEFVSTAGKTFDALGTPEAYKFWNEGQFLKSVDKHLLKSNDFTVVDLSGASKAQVAAIQEHVSSLAEELQEKIIYVGN